MDRFICYLFVLFLISFTENKELTLKQYQIEGAEFLIRMIENLDYMGALLADDMGLGKTGITPNIRSSVY